MNAASPAGTRRLVLALSMALPACGGAAVDVTPAYVDPAPVAAPTVQVARAPVDAAEAEGKRKVAEMLRRVAAARGLPVKGEVASKVLDRSEVLTRIRAHVEKDVPLDVVRDQGEVLAALELVPPEFDFVEGAFKLIQGRIAGFYEPEDRTFYMVSDLDDDEATETLAHELVHALQDQTWPLAKMVAFVPGDGDRLAAVHSLIEGDAMSAMLDVVGGSAFNFSEASMRQLLGLSNAMSKETSAMPHVLQTSLAAPYGDGFAFVQGRRAKGGWPGVDASWNRLPQTTEQLLHQDKYESAEPAVPVAVPAFTSLGEGFKAAVDDVMGEQGIKLMLDEWTFGATASEAAAGWGGDRYVLAQKDAGAGKRVVAAGWRMVFDTPKDAGEMATVLETRFGKKCKERKALGPIAWKRQGAEVVLAAGPYERDGKATKSAGDCKLAGKWVDEISKQGGSPRAKR